MLLKRFGRAGAQGLLRKRFGYDLMLPYGHYAHARETIGGLPSAVYLGSRLRRAD